MSETVQRAIASGVVVRTESGFRCTVCDRSLSEVEPHLQGRDHFNNLAWEVLINPAQHPSLNDIPRVVLEAKQRNEMELVDRAVFSYRCLVCPKRPLSNGVRPLESHLKGSGHENARTLSSLGPSARPSSVVQPQLPTSSHTSDIHNTQPSFAPRNPEPPQYQPLPGQRSSLAPAQYPPTDGPQARYPSLYPQPPSPMHQYSQTPQPQQPAPLSQYPQPPSPMHQYSQTPQPQQPAPLSQYPPSNQPSASGGLDDTTGLDPELQRALGEGVVQRGDGQSFRCRACNITSTGVAPCLEHLKSGRHMKKAQVWMQQPLTNPQPANPPPQQQCQPPQPAAALPQPTPLSIGGLAGATGLDPELQRALNEGVIERGDGQAFRCRVCDRNLTGVAPCLEHLQSSRHRGRAQTWTLQMQPLSDFERLTIRSEQVSRSNFDSQPIGAGRPVDQVDDSWSFPWPLVTGTEYVPPSERVYRNLSMPRGLVLIFNYYFTGQGDHERHGARRDSFNLKTLFHRLGYLVYLYEDLRKSETEQALAMTQGNPCLRDYDCLIVFILSHGKDDQIFYTASSREEDCMRLDDVRYRFTDTECPALKGKPKIFFVNFCRKRRQTDYDGMSPERSEPLDMMTIYSCINTFMAPRHPELGTFFVQAWCKVLAAHAHNEELLELHFRVSQLMREMNGSVPEQQGYHFKKFYFNPVYTG